MAKNDRAYTQEDHQAYVRALSGKLVAWDEVMGAFAGKVRLTLFAAFGIVSGTPPRSLHRAADAIAELESCLRGKAFTQMMTVRIPDGDTRLKRNALNHYANLYVDAGDVVQLAWECHLDRDKSGLKRRRKTGNYYRALVTILHEAKPVPDDIRSGLITLGKDGEYNFDSLMRNTRNASSAPLERQKPPAVEIYAIAPDGSRQSLQTDKASAVKTDSTGAAQIDSTGAARRQPFKFKM